MQGRAGQRRRLRAPGSSVDTVAGRGPWLGVRKENPLPQQTAPRGLPGPLRLLGTCNFVFMGSNKNVLKSKNKCFYNQDDFYSLSKKGFFFGGCCFLG